MVATALACLGSAAECQPLHVYFNESLVADAAQDRDMRKRLEERYARFNDLHFN